MGAKASRHTHWFWFVVWFGVVWWGWFGDDDGVCGVDVGGGGWVGWFWWWFGVVAVGDRHGASGVLV
ncbi:hypothetical protein BW737_015320 [Actinomyces ruminis]|uniref:Transmembrane protein n=1 Tax=Actinomyces ruminis TaxID=1937003 RepID=A0ABX4M8N9_9ACTO|nr:hypothetical protein BW737_015320 [Actinomyces ruminis]